MNYFLLISCPYARKIKPACESLWSVTTFRELMERNYIYNMKLEEFARLSGRSLTSFKRDFIATFKTTPGKWLARKKLEYARHLLETTDKDINELTFESGFENSLHFIRIFKQAFKNTPLKYKKNVLQQISDF